VIRLKVDVTGDQDVKFFFKREGGRDQEAIVVTSLTRRRVSLGD
jgi:hypothetical protein